MNTHDRHCCIIECDNAATAHIIHECGGPECDTDSCDDHIGELLGCNYDRGDYPHYHVELITVPHQLEPL